MLGCLFSSYEGHRSETVRLRGFIGKQEVFMLVDSRSSNCFISEELAARFEGKRALANPVPVKVADGNIIECTHEIPNQL